MNFRRELDNPLNDAGTSIANSINRRSGLLSAASAVLLLAATGCGPGKGDEKNRCEEMLPGDLVISEYLHNVPTERRDSGQWFEIHNPTKADIELDGLTIYRSQHSGSGRKTERLASGVVPAGGYYVFGNAPEDAKPEWMDHSYGDRLGNLNLTQGRVGILCGNKVLDEVVYVGSGSSNKSRSFDGTVTPDAAANDDMARWCDATTEYEPGRFGTPGAANDGCEPVIEDPNVCFDADSGEKRDVVRPAVGDVRITEFHASSNAVADTAGEWVELHATKDVDLNGLELRNEGTGKTAFTSSTCLRIPAGGHAVLARNADPLANGGVENVLATFHFGLSNTGDRAIELWNGDTQIERVEYSSVTKGVSRQLAETSEDDDTLTWCPTPTGFAYGAGDRGTPGVANPRCDAGVPVDPLPETCVDPATEEARELLSPVVGDLRITEVLPSAGAAEDANGEWIEISVNADVDLNGVTVRNEGIGATELRADECLRVAAGTRIVLARSLITAVNGGLEDVYAPFSFNLANSGARAVRLTLGELELDRMDYSSVTKGVSLQLAETSKDDDTLKWCPTPAGFTYGAGDRGTPGAENPRCDETKPVDPVGKTCIDPDTDEVRELVSPAVGDVRITEFLASPNAVTEASGEWVELYAEKDVDLNGVELRNEGSGKTAFTSDACLRIPAGSYAVLARNVDAQVNGGVDPVLATFNFSLANTGDRSIELWNGETRLDRVEYANAAKGISRQLAERSDEDDELVWCPTPEGVTYGAGDRGTPGAANPFCEKTVIVDPPVAMCFDAVTGEERERVSPQPGDLRITELLPSAAAVNDAAGEWVEIEVAADVDLNGVALRNETNGVTRLESDECLRVAAGSRIVLARSADSSVNGGIDDVYATFSFNFGNSNPRAARLTLDDVELDRMDYASTTKGVSIQYAPPTFGSDEREWCLTPVGFTYGDGDRGTPGAENPPCDGSDGSDPGPDPFTCIDPDSSERRDLVSPVLGDVTITEIHANASVGSDGQWVELTVHSAVDLNGLALDGEDDGEIVFESDTCLHALPGTRLVLARNADGLSNGGLATIDALFTAVLPASDGAVRITVDDVEIDRVDYADTTDGASLQLAATSDEDDTLIWCATPETHVYGDGDRGTPGEENPPCTIVVVEPPEPMCFDAVLGEERAIIAPASGDLAITEIHTSPTAVAAEYGQWIEAVADGSFDLNGLAIQAGGKETILEAIDCQPVNAGDRLVFARSADDLENGGIDSVSVLFDFELPADGTLVLAQGEEEIERVDYESVIPGASLQLAVTSDEDETLIWCPTPEAHTYGAGDRGTPGAENPPCTTVDPGPQPALCLDVASGEPRESVAPGPGDLTITEIHASPLAVAAEYGQWIEVAVNGSIDLNGVVIRYGGSESVVQSVHCYRSTPGERLVFARSFDQHENGGVLSVVWPLNDNLPTDGTVVVAHGEEVLDSVDYESVEGASLQLAATSDEDDTLVWCPTPEAHTYGAGDRGTPGAENPPCTTVVEEPPVPMCFDRALGEERPIVFPVAGDLLITEFLASATVSDADGEYIEIHATADVDLNGVRVGNESTTKLIVADADCVRLEQGSFGLLVRKWDAGVNGGLPNAFMVGDFNFNLANSGDRSIRLLLDDEAQTVLTEVAYTAAHVSKGVSFQLDPTYFGLATSENLANWCSTPEGNIYEGEIAGDPDPVPVVTRGTPGEANAACPIVVPEGMCLDTATNTVRYPVAPTRGDIILTEFVPSPDESEWIELYATASVDLNGVELSTRLDPAPIASMKTLLSSETCLSVTAGQHVILRRNVAVGVEDYLAEFTFALLNSNSAGRGIFVVYDGELLDSATFGTAVIDVSRQLDVATYGHLIDDDVQADWCNTPTSVDGRQTPGALNVSCR